MKNNFFNTLCLAYSLSSLGVRLLGMTSSKQNGIFKGGSRVKKIQNGNKLTKCIVPLKDTLVSYMMVR